MPADQSVFQIGAVVDTATLQAGFDAGAAGAQNFADTLNVKLQGGRAASIRAFNGISSDVKLMAENVSEASAKIASATTANIQAQQNVRKALVLVKDATVDAATSQSILAAAQERARATAAELAETQEALAGATEHVVTGQQAASAAIRSLEGNAGIRAVENFVSKTLGLGPLLKGLFPVIGAFAFLDVVVKMGEELYKAFDLGGERARATEQAIRGVNDELRDSSTSLDVQIDKLQQEQAKLEHKPFNGMKLAMDEAAQAAENLQKKLDGVIQREIKAIEGMSASMPQRLVAGGSKTTYESTMLQEHTKWLDLANTAQGKYNETTSYAASLQTRLNELLGKRKEDAAVALESHSYFSPTKYNEEIAAVQQMIVWQKEEQAQLQKEAALQQQTTATQGARDKSAAAKLDNTAARQAAEEQRKADQELMRSLEVTSLTQKTVFASMADNDRAFWQSKLGLFREGTEQYLEVLRKIESADKRAEEEAKKRAEAQKKDAEEGTKALVAGMNGMAKWSKEYMEDLTRTGERWDGYYATVARGQEQSAATTEALGLQHVKQLLAVGSLSELGAAHQEAALHAETQRLKIKALEEELERLQKLAAKKTIDPVTGQEVLDPRLAGQIAQTQSALNQAKGSATLQSGQDSQAIANQVAKPYLTAFSTIENGWMSAQRSMLTGQKSFAQAMQQMWGTIAMDGIASIEKLGFNFVRHEILMTAQHATQKAAQLSTDASSAAASTAIAKTQNATQGLDAAKLAFKNVYAQVSGWPFVGPVMAPILAAGAFTAVAAFEQGTMHVPREGLAVLHPGEAVLTNPNASMMRDALSGKLSGGGSGENHFHFGGNHFGSGDAQSSGLAAHEAQMVRTLKRLHRDGKLDFARSR